jgi:hypothetical protein
LTAYVVALCWIISTVPGQSSCQVAGTPRATVQQCRADLPQWRRVERHEATWAYEARCVALSAPVYF